MLIKYKNIIKYMNEKDFVNKPINNLKIIVLMVQKGFEIDDEFKSAIKNNAHLLKNENKQIIGSMFMDILSDKKSHKYISLMDKLGILSEIFPVTDEMRSVGECKYHAVNSLKHSIYTLRELERFIYNEFFFENHINKKIKEHLNKKVGNYSRLTILKLGAFFHDVGKPSAKYTDIEGRIRFRGHEIVGADVIRKIADEIYLHKDEVNILYKLVRHHMIPLVLYKENDLSNDKLLKFFNEVQDEVLDILLIGYSDIVATRRLLNPDEDLEMYKIHIEYIANNYITKFILKN